MSIDDSSTYSNAPNYAEYPEILEYVSPVKLPAVSVDLPAFSVAVKRNTGNNYQVKASWHPNPENAATSIDHDDGLHWFVIKHSELAEDIKEDIKELDEGVVILPEDIDHVFFWGLDTPRPADDNQWVGDENFKLWVEISDEISDADGNVTRNIVFQRYVGGEVQIHAPYRLHLHPREFAGQKKHWHRFCAILDREQYRQTIREQWAQQEKIYEAHNLAKELEALRPTWALLYAWNE